MIELLFVFSLFVFARAGGWLAVRLGAESALGEIIGGVVLANIIMLLAIEGGTQSVIHGNSLLEHTVVLAIGVLMLLAGIELMPRQLRQNLKTGLPVALAGALVPFVMGAALVWFAMPDTEQRFVLALVTGLALSITAIPAAVKILEDLGLMASDLGITIITAALLDDVIGLALMAFVIALALTGTTPSLTEVALLAAKVAVFFAIAIGLGNHVFPHVRRSLELVDAAALELSVLIFVSFLYGMIAEVMGLHWILGPFMAGLFFEPARVGQQAYEETRDTVTVLVRAGLGPMFFASIGLHVDLGSVGAAPLFLVALIGVAVLGKAAGAGGAARMLGMSTRDAAAVGIGMSARGAVEIVILNILLVAGVFGVSGADGLGADLFSLLVITAVATTALVPPLLRLILKPR